MSTKVKICGVTNADDALAAAHAGADMIGLLFYTASVRGVTLDQAEAVCAPLSDSVARVGVFVNPTADFVMQAIARCALNILQFHGEEPPEFCTQFGLMSMKAFRVRDAASLEELPAYATDAWLLDAWVPDKRGGSGTQFNWDLAVQAKELGRPIFLAGGLNPENVREAVMKVQPFAVDVSSGVESGHGKKDHGKVASFINAVRKADRAVEHQGWQ